MIYTDSRGFDVVTRSVSGSYVGLLRKNYHVTGLICPETYTTIVDFLNHVELVNQDDYDAIVMHCGVVDFSPRPLSSISKVAAAKAHTPRFGDVFRSNETYHQAGLSGSYYGEPTVTLYSKDYLRMAILPELTALRNLIWINSNHFVPGWDGNYFRGRPENIDSTVSEFDAVMQRDLVQTIDLKVWTREQVKECTVDNIHFTRRGFARIAQLIDQRVQTLMEATQR